MRVNINIVSYAKIIKALMEGHSSSADLADLTGMHIESVRTFLKIMRREGLIYIGGWDADRTGRISIRLWSLGTEPDAERPIKRRKTNKEWRKRTRDALLLGLMR